jgi:hypothetical protein
MLALLGSLRKATATGVATNSLRFRASNSAYLSRTFSTPTNSAIFTWSAWVKRGQLGVASRLFGVGANTYLTFDSSDKLNLTHNSVNNFTSGGFFRDPFSWYHIVYTQNVSSLTVYVNGSSVGTAGLSNTIFNTAVQHQIAATNTLNYFDGYITEINFVDGQALTPSSFGQLNSTTGVWEIIKYGGSYGTNGFYLKFADTSAATAAAIGKDTSGNGNNWTPSGISVTTGVTYDSMLDVPNNYADGGNGRGNYAVINSLSLPYLTTTFAEANLLATVPSAAPVLSTRVIGSMAFPTSGLWYVEADFTTDATAGEWSYLGVSSTGVDPLNGVLPGTSSTEWVFVDNGFKRNNNTLVSYGTSQASSFTLRMAVNMNTGKVWVGDSVGWFSSGNPVSDTNEMYSGLPASLFPMAAFTRSTTTSQTVRFNFGQRPFAYTPPTGFLALNTQNLPTPAIANGASVMAATTYTGTASALTITNTNNGVSFQPDFVWIKRRSGVTADNHALYDSVRGTTKDLVSNLTAAETTQATGLTAFNASGFGIGTLAKLNTATATYIAWQWKAGGAAVSNTAGTITSQVSANTTAGFSVVTATKSASANCTIGHGLDVAPKMVIFKTRDSAADSWGVWHAALAGTEWLVLNTPAAKSTNANIWNSTAPTSSVISIGTNWAGTLALAYCFAEVAGFSKFGSYIGNGTVNGQFVYCGFRPRWVILKRTDAADSFGWLILDTSRDVVNPVSQYLGANTAAIEGTLAVINALSNGFQLKIAGADGNVLNGSYIFAAFAENPSKYALAR